MSHSNPNRKTEMEDLYSSLLGTDIEPAEQTRVDKK